MKSSGHSAALSPAELLAAEQGTIRKDAPWRVALVYPSPYNVAMSSLGYQTIYRTICNHPDWAAERAFLPDEGIPADPLAPRPALRTLEGGRPVSDCAVVAFSLAYELELPGLIECLHRAGLPILAKERRSEHPLVVLGGPLTFSNPMPAAPFADIIILGEAEEAVPLLLDHVANLPSRDLLLGKLAQEPGFYVPRIHNDQLPEILRTIDANLPAYSQVVTPHTELSNMFLIEDARGCSRGCTYCVMGRWSGGMRRVDKAEVLGRIPSYAPRVGLVGAAVSDHPDLVEIVATIVEGGRGIGLSSLRADRITPDLVKYLKLGGNRTLTTASDGASQRLRDFIDRKTKEKHLLAAAKMVADAGVERLKLYEMVGLPGETDADIDELIAFSLELVRTCRKLSLGIAPFVAKHRTPLDKAPFEALPVLDRRLDRLRRGLAGRVDVRPTSTRWAYVEYRLAQGGPEAGLAGLEAWRNGLSFAAWKRALAKVPLPEVVVPTVPEKPLRVGLAPPLPKPGGAPSYML